MRRNRQKEKTPDASGHMAAAPGVCCYLFVLVCEIEFLAVIVRIRHTFQLGKGLLGQRPHIPVHTRHGYGIYPVSVFYAGKAQGLIGQHGKEPVHAHRLGGFNDVPEMLLIVQLIEIPPDGAALCAGQLHRIGQYLVTGLFSIELPCVVLPGAFQENVTLPKTVCPRGPGHPKQGLIHGLIAGGVPMDNAFVNKE